LLVADNFNERTGNNRQDDEEDDNIFKHFKPPLPCSLGRFLSFGGSSTQRFRP
jgi:hypothetical protein